MMFARNAALFLALATGSSAFVAPSQSHMSTRLAAEVDAVSDAAEVDAVSESPLMSDIKVAVCPFVYAEVISEDS